MQKYYNKASHSNFLSTAIVVWTSCSCLQQFEILCISCEMQLVLTECAVGEGRRWEYCQGELCRRQTATIIHINIVSRTGYTEDIETVFFFLTFEDDFLSFTELSIFTCVNVFEIVIALPSCHKKRQLVSSSQPPLQTLASGPLHIVF